MEKKMVGILAGVAAVHVVLLAGLMASGGCRQPEILGNQTYNNGPALGEIPAPAEKVSSSAPTVPGGELPAVPATAATEKSETSGKYPALHSATPSTAKTAPATGTTTYKVVKGDTLSGIAYRHGVKTRELMACNNLTAKSVLRIGQELKIPEGGVYHAESKAASSHASAKSTKNAASSAKNTKSAKSTNSVKSAKASSAATVAAPADGVHVVAAGDTLDRIGRKYGVSAKAIAQENNIALNKVLHIGDKLRIPGKGATAVSGQTGTQTKSDNSGLPLDSGMDLDPNIGLTPATGTATTGPGAAATAPAATTPGTAAATAPAAGTPAATTPAAAATTPAAGVTGGSTALANTETLQVPNDMTAEQFCKMYNVKMEDLKRLNPDLPADGKLKSGAHMIVPTL